MFNLHEFKMIFKNFFIVYLDRMSDHKLRISNANIVTVCDQGELFKSGQHQGEVPGIFL